MALRGQLEALGVLQWVLTFLFFGLFFLLLLVYLLFTPFWSLSALYFLWWMVDLDTPEQGAPPAPLPRAGPPAARQRPWGAPGGAALSDPMFPFPVGRSCGAGESGRDNGGRAQSAGTVSRAGALGAQLGLSPEVDRWTGQTGTASSQPCAGGRRSEWIRRWKVWELHRDYFPIKLVKTAELLPTRNYVLGSHPHGIICAGAFSAFSTEACGFSRAFPGLTPSLALLAGLFYLPVYREYLMSAGMVPVSKKSLDFLLGAGPGHAVAIVVGGAQESLEGKPGEQRLHLSGRRGFVRLALQHGADLVPVFSFGENDIFRQLHFREGGSLRRLQLRFKQLAGFAPCLFVGRCLFSSRCWGLLPHRSPITVVVGKPIPVPLRPHPTPEEVGRYHACYVQALQELFEEHKGSCGLPPSQKLLIV